MLYPTADSVFYDVLKTLLQGKRTQSRDGDTRECLGYHFSVYEPRACFVHDKTRCLSPMYAAGEMLYYMNPAGETDQVAAYALRYRGMTTPFIDHGSYGRRWAPQLRNLVNVLSGKQGTRQAVLSTYRDQDLLEAALGTPNIPCTLTLQFIERNDSLNLLVSMRSNDAWLGLPNDMFCFMTLQCLVAESLGMGIGKYYHSVGSMHLYERDVVKAHQAVNSAAVNVPCPGHASQEHDLLSYVELAVSLERRIRFTAQCCPERLDDVLKMIGQSFGRSQRWRALLAGCWLNFANPTCNVQLAGEMLADEYLLNRAVYLMDRRVLGRREGQL